MTVFFKGFQISMLLAFLALFLGRTIWLRAKHGVRVFTLVSGKQGLNRCIELSFFILLPLWMCALCLRVFAPSLMEWDAPILVSLPLGLLGIVLIVGGFILFIWALISFGRFLANRDRHEELGPPRDHRRIRVFTQSHLCFH